MRWVWELIEEILKEIIKAPIDNRLLTDFEAALSKTPTEGVFLAVVLLTALFLAVCWPLVGWIMKMMDGRRNPRYLVVPLLGILLSAYSAYGFVGAAIAELGRRIQ